MKKKRFCIWMLVYVFICTICRGQALSVPEIIPATPEATAIAKYLNYPVSYNRGLADITIPLSEIDAGDLKIPLALSYHASGLKVSERDGWIGLGWSLSPLPAISRSVKGKPDEKGYLSNPRVTSNSAQVYKEPQYMDNLANNVEDEEPDEFYYQLLGKSGSFYFQKNGGDISIVTLPYDPIKIEYEYYEDASGKKSDDIARFKITDTDGTVYIFSEIEITDAGSQIVTGWKVKEIYPPNKDRNDMIEFAYESTMERYTQIKDVITVEDCTETGTGAGELPHYSSLVQPQYPVIRDVSTNASQVRYYNVDWNTHNLTEVNTKEIMTPVSASGYNVYGKKLKQIKFRGGKVEFTSSAETNTFQENYLRLDKIRVLQDLNSGDYCSFQIKFEREKYSVLSSTNTLSRYKLKKVIFGSDIQDLRWDNENQIYSFEYNDGGLPDMLRSKDIDYWGYYNAAHNDEQKSLLPEMTIELPAGLYTRTFKIGGANREANEQAMQVGMLKKILYPTGGYTEFIYEANRFKTDNKLKVGGGLRIKSIQDYDPVSGKTLFRTYRYGQNEDGIGISRWSQAPEDFMYKQDMAYQIPLKNTISYKLVSTSLITCHSESLADYFYSNGSAVLYDKVSEYQCNIEPGQVPSASNILGKTVYQYDSEWPVIYQPPLSTGGTTPFYVNWKTDWEHGQLLKKSVLKPNGDTLSVTNYQYVSQYRGKICSRKLFRTYNPIVCAGPELDISLKRYADFFYEYLTGLNKLASEHSTEFFDNSRIEKTKTYTYDLGNTGLLTKTVENSPTETISKSYVYPHNRTSTPVYQEMVGKNMISPVLEESIENGSTKIKHTRTNYAKTSHGFILPQSIETSTGGDFRTEVTFDLYNEKGNLRQYTRADGTPVTYIWGYSNRYPIAEIINADFNRVSDDFGTGQLTNIENTRELSESALTSVSSFHRVPMLQCTTFTYKPGVGVTSVTDSDSVTTYYMYDALGRLTKVYMKENGEEKVLQYYLYNYKNY